MINQCKICKKNIKTFPSVDRKTCSRLCESKLKSIQKIGINNPCYGKPTWNSGLHTGIVPKTAFKFGFIPWNKGKNHTAISGENNVNWKGGITKEVEKIRKSIEYNLWRDAIFSRDGWTCTKCNIKGGSVVAHHIQNFSEYPELRFAIDNGTTLCKSCHTMFHLKFGFRKNTNNQLLEFLNKEQYGNKI